MRVEETQARHAVRARSETAIESRIEYKKSKKQRPGIVVQLITTDAVFKILLFCYSAISVGASTEFFRTLAIPFLHAFIVV